MNTDAAGAAALAGGLAEKLKDNQAVDTAVCPPFVYLKHVADALGGSNIKMGAQDVFYEGNGAFTGEISCEMLRDVCCTYVIIGHSERRHVIKESDELIAKKLSAAISGGLRPILCVGELLEEREANKTNDVVIRQLNSAFEGLSAEQLENTTLAYEPVWAIGTGKTASPDQAQEVHSMIRGLLKDMYGAEVSENMRIQYGGSAKPGNTKELMAEPDVDGLLVGGASLKVDDFADMIKIASGG